jgi:hypothetical protein
VLAKGEVVEHGANTATNESLDFVRATSDRCALAWRATARCAREHRIFRCEPSLAATFAPTRHSLLDADCAENSRLAEHGETGPFGLTRCTALESYGA